jgi:seryl-tRNA synthetase
LQQKADLEKEKKRLEEVAAEKEAALLKKVSTIGNYVHDTVPVSNNEVSVASACVGSMTRLSMHCARMTIN